MGCVPFRSHKLKKKWLVDANGKKFDVPHDDIGKMFESNCYIIDTTYTLKGEERHALYVFYGRRALPADRAAADKKAGKLAKKTKKVGPDCRVIPMEQGRPDSQFVSLFHGALVTFRGEAMPRRRLAFALPFNTKFGEVRKEFSKSILLFIVSCVSAFTQSFFIHR